MKRNGNISESPVFLRKKAEELLNKQQSKPGSQLAAADGLKLIHELEVHQIELEMQNEELILSRSAAIDSAERYTELYDFSPVGYFTLSREGKIIELNLYGSQMLGKERANLTNKYFGSFISIDTKLIFDHFLSRVFDSRIKESCEVSLINNPNTATYAHLTGMITENEEQCLVNTMDITGRKQAETALALKNEELTRLNAEKDKFFSILAHDLRSPLSSFLGLTKMFSEELSGMKQEEVQELANSLRESAKSVYHLLENLLDWSQMQRGLIEFKPVRVHLNDIIRKSIGSLSDLANQKNQEVQLQLSGNPFVRVDLTMLESTLRNLLSNALKFSFRGGQITLSTNVLQDKFVEIAIIDNGLGMSAGLISRLFTLDGQTGRSGTEGEHSTGLGLLLCKEFVEKNGGEIVAVSVEGKGSTFSFTLPIYTDPS
jgi:PAS domain S-box-containing protein